MKASTWDLSTIYSSIEDPAFHADRARALSHLASLRSDVGALPGHWSESALAALWPLYLEVLEGRERLSTFCQLHYAADTADAAALGALSGLDQDFAPLREVEVRLGAWLGAHLPPASHLPGAAAGTPSAAQEGAVESPSAAGFANATLVDHAYHLREMAARSSRRMAPELEALAAELAPTGGAAWERMKDSVWSRIRVPWPGDSEGKPMSWVRQQAQHPDRAERARAWHGEMEAWPRREEEIAAALNSIKGEAIALARRRGYASVLDTSLEAARMSRAELDGLLDALVAARSLFRRYYRAKAELLGVDRLRWYDLVAPPPAAGTQAAWTWEGAHAFVAAQFDRFDAELGAMFRMAVRERWIDAEPRPGKVGGAFCSSIPGRHQSRILLNFGGGLGDVTTLAHEAGHAWHNHVLRGKSALQADVPMTLAETASIFCETLVTESALETLPSGERLAVLDESLSGMGQVLVDIHSRFLFESRLLAERERGSVSPARLCALMREAQVECYGDAIDPDYLHPWMWAVKPHYYSPGLHFYNYPYAFGLLFALGLYARSKREGPGFAAEYRRLLERTGDDDVAGVARAAGYDLTGPGLWHAGLEVVESRLQFFLEAAAVPA